MREWLKQSGALLLAALILGTPPAQAITALPQDYVKYPVMVT